MPLTKRKGPRMLWMAFTITTTITSEPSYNFSPFTPIIP